MNFPRIITRNLASFRNWQAERESRALEKRLMKLCPELAERKAKIKRGTIWHKKTAPILAAQRADMNKLLGVPSRVENQLARM